MENHYFTGKQGAAHLGRIALHFSVILSDLCDKNYQPE